MDELRSAAADLSEEDLTFLATDARVKPVIEALLHLGVDLQDEVTRHRARADDAESALREALAQLEQVRLELGQTLEQASALLDMEAAERRNAARLEEVRRTWEENRRSEQALIAIARFALGVGPPPPPFEAAPPGPTTSPMPQTPPRRPAEAGRPQPAPTLDGESGKSGAEDRGPEQAQAGTSLPPHPDPPPCSGEPQVNDLASLFGLAADVVYLTEETTDEHKIIDARNRVDMERLNARSYVQSLRSGRASGR